MLRLLVFVLLLPVLFSGCLGKRYLKPNQTILDEQRLNSTDRINKDEVKSLYLYKPNRKILIIPWVPYVDIYRLGLKRYDSVKYETKKAEINKKLEKKLLKVEGKEKRQKKIRDRSSRKTDKQNHNIKEGNLFMRMGEPLAVFDTTKENQTVEKIKRYFHSKGYFNAEVSYDSIESFKLVTTTYNIKRNEPYVVDSIFYNIADTSIENIILKNKINIKLKKREGYKEQNITAERERIYALLLNNGYYNFKRQYIHFIVDSSTMGNKRVMVELSVRNPANTLRHRAFKIDSVIFTTDADIENLPEKRKSEFHEGIKYQFYNKRYSKKILNSRIFIRSGNLYSQSNTFKTKKHLSSMDIYKFINVDYDTTGGLFIANVFTSRLKQYQTSFEAGLNLNRQLPEPFLNATVKNRNTFLGLEVMELNGRIGFEDLSGIAETGDNPYSSFEYSANLTLVFPQFVFPLGHKIKSNLNYINPQTKISIGYNNSKRSEYEREKLNASLGYVWQGYESKKEYTLNIADINFIDSGVTTEYQEFLDELVKNGNNLKNSFRPSFVSSSWLTMAYNTNNYGNQLSKSSYFHYKIEAGGNLHHLIGKSAFNESIELFRFTKFSIDYRHFIPLPSGLSLAYHTSFGVAISHGKNKTLPYEKFFFSGGGNSVRAWQPRRLGPGSFLPIDSLGNYNNNFEQPGEIAFETSIEFRHHLLSFLFGAIFIDVGNVWSIREDPIRPGADFKLKQFYKEIAVGTGYGFRFDFSFLLLRLDVAWKIYDPGRQSKYGMADTRGRFELPDYNNYKRLVWNLGIGYPF